LDPLDALFRRGLCPSGEDPGDLLTPPQELTLGLPRTGTTLLSFLLDLDPSNRSLLAWEAGGITTGPEAWGPLPADLKLPAVLEELGENLLRACPTDGVLLTTDDADAYAAWYMRFARGLRPDLLVVPLAAWRADAVLRARLAADLKLGRHSNGDAWLAELARRRPALILLDLMMPEMDGFEFLEACRRQLAWRDIPVIVLTAKELTDEDRRRLNGCVEKVLQKGAYSRQSLLREIRDLVAACARPAATAKEGTRPNP